MPDSLSSVAFLERAGLIPTHRTQISPKLDLTNLIAYELRTAPPLPLPELLQPNNGEPSPDRTATQPWPWPLRIEAPGG